MTDPATGDVPRRFLLNRHRDLSGVSGTGLIMEAVMWTDGTIALKWRGRYPTTTVWNHGIEALMEVHGHKGNTTIQWIDTPPGNPWDQHDDPTVPHQPPHL